MGLPFERLPDRPRHVVAFDDRALIIFSRGEQIIGRLQGAMEDLTAVHMGGHTAMGDPILTQESKDRILRAQREIAAVIKQTRERVLPPR